MEAIRELQRVRERLETQLRAIQSEMDAVSKAIKVLEREQPQSVEIKGKELSALTFTDAVRRLISEEYVTPLKVRDQLIRGGFPHSKDKTKLLNSVWATMQRLVKGSGFEQGKLDGKFAVRRTRSSESTLPLGDQKAAVQ